MIDGVTTPESVRPLIIPELLTLPAQIDMSNAVQVSESIQAVLGPLVVAVVADLTATVFCDSAGARALLAATERAEEHHAQLRLVIPAGPVLRTLTILGLGRLLRIYPTTAAALSGSGEPRR